MERLTCFRYSGKRKIHTYFGNVISEEQSNHSKMKEMTLQRMQISMVKKVKKERIQHIKLTRTDHRGKVNLKAEDFFQLLCAMNQNNENLNSENKLKDKKMIITK